MYHHSRKLRNGLQFVTEKDFPRAHPQVAKFRKGEGDMESDPLLRPSLSLIGFTDYLGHPINNRSISGRWTAALFIVGVEMAERFAYYGISSNLIMYLTGPLGESTAGAAVSISTWDGFSLLMPLIGAFVADSYIGRYQTIVVASVLYILGLSMLTVSSILPSMWAHFQVILFYISLYLVGLAQGFHKPCVQAFGADQFDQNDAEECVYRSSFFNWWFFGVTVGSMISFVVSSYIQDNISWALGFGIPSFLMVIALVVFVWGKKTYRYHLLEDIPFTNAGRGFAILVRNRGTPICDSSDQRRATVLVGEQDTQGLDAYAQSMLEEDGGVASTELKQEAAKEVLRLFPIWATCLTYGIVIAQYSFFTKQASTMDRRIFSSFQVPPAALQTLICVAIIISVPIYDRASIVIFTLLQRIGSGLLVSIVTMIVAALVEKRRLQTARDFGLIDLPNVAIPMSLWWLVPQYFLYGTMQVFASIGMQEFFYDQIPASLRSLGIALYLSVLGIGSFINSFIISVTDEVTRKMTGDSWISNNLNRAHLDYYYLLVAGLSALGLAVFLLFSRAYVYKK